MRSIEDLILLHIITFMENLMNLTKSLLKDLKVLFVEYKYYAKHELKAVIIEEPIQLFKKIAKFSFDLLAKAKTYLTIKGTPITILVILLSILYYIIDLPSTYLYITLFFYLVHIFARKIDSRFPIAGALLLLIITPFYLIKNLESYANYLATIAYFLLVIGVIRQFYEYVKNHQSQTGNMMQ